MEGGYLVFIIGSLGNIMNDFVSVWARDNGTVL